MIIILVVNLEYENHERKVTERIHGLMVVPISKSSPVLIFVV